MRPDRASGPEPSSRGEVRRAGSAGCRQCGRARRRGHAWGSTSLSLAAPMRVYIAAARLPPRSEPANKHDFRPRAIPLSALSVASFERQMRPPPRRQVERRRWLVDLLAVPTGELLAHRLDHLPLARNGLQRPGDVLADLRELLRAAAFNIPARARQKPQAACLGGLRLNPGGCRKLPRVCGDRILDLTTGLG